MGQIQVEKGESYTEVFQKLYETYFHELCQYTFCRIGNRANAEDVVQIAFLIAYRKIDVLAHSPNQIGWLYRTVQNVMKNEKKKEIRAQILQKKLEEQVIVERPVERSIEEAFRGLISDLDLELLILFYIEGHPQRELAHDFGISLSACKMRIQRAKALLRECISKSELQ